MQGLIPRYHSRFDIVDAHYWWNVDHHEGQWSDSYKRLCRIQRYFQPSRLADSVESEEARDIYNQLCVNHGCQHDET